MKVVTTRPLPGARVLRFGRQDDEASRVVLLVLDVLGEDVEAVNVGGNTRGEGGTSPVAPFRDLSRSAGRVAGDVRLEPVLADDATALAERVDVAVDVGDFADLDALQRHELEADRQEVLADDVEAGLRQQVVDVGDAAGERVLDRDHRIAGFTRFHGGDRILERRTRQRLELGIHLVGMRGVSWRRAHLGRRCADGARARTAAPPAGRSSPLRKMTSLVTWNWPGKRVQAGVRS